MRVKQFDRVFTLLLGIYLIYDALRARVEDPDGEPEERIFYAVADEEQAA